MLSQQIEEFIKEKCPQKGFWCNGRHIPTMKKTAKKGVNGYTVFTDEDLNKARDAEPCIYFKKNHCAHPDNPKNKTHI